MPLKIYTKTGDEGDTSLFAGGRVRKSDSRVAAYGDVDELSALLGAAHHHLPSWPALRAELEQVQRVLFGIGGEIAAESEGAREKLRDLVSNEHVVALERSIDEMEAALPALDRFIMPGGGPAGAALHVARTVCRRAERSVETAHANPAGRRTSPCRVERHLRQQEGGQAVAAAQRLGDGVPQHGGGGDA